MSQETYPVHASATRHLSTKASAGSSLARATHLAEKE